MLARLQQAITLSLIVLAGAWAAWFAAAGRPFWALGGALAIVFGYAAFLAIEFVALAFVHGDDPSPAASAAQLLRAWWGEVVTAPRVFCWRQPFRSNAEPDHLPDHAQGRRGVLLVHGFVCNRGFWNPWMKRLRAAGVPFIAVNLEPVFGSIDAYLPTLDAAARRLHDATGLAPLVVAHSMGGVAVRAWLHGVAGATAAHHVITIGTPHRGTWLARFSLTSNGHQMGIDNPWLVDLRSRESLHPDEPRDAAAYSRFTCFYGHCDNIVFPPSTATLPGADNRHVAATAHVHLAFQDAVFNEAWRWVGPSAASTAGALAAQ
jgi:triacylglycerol esterase/lipase EstA (alpha/beta hydrolase family)